ncbi:hypothetical protein ACFU6I_33830 [Streptomyces sp. NPDC057486]
MKLSGHLLDEAGYRRGTVPIDGWSALDATEDTDATAAPAGQGP